MNSPFLMTTCQVGAESALKNELAQELPAARLAFSRPGFVTFKLPAGVAWPEHFPWDSIFARWYGWSLGKVKATGVEALADAVAEQLAGQQTFEQLHVFPRDRYEPGDHRFEPGLTSDSAAAAEVLRARLGSVLSGDHNAPPARLGQSVLDVVMVEDDEWWLGTHRASRHSSPWAGGLRVLTLPPHAVSRAYLKAVEGLEWSRLPIAAGQTAAEIGCAPGGASQVLLERGLKVIGIDPALIEPVVAEHPNFVHLRKRGHEVRRQEFRGVHWLLADLNVAPNYTLDTIEGIVTHPSVHIRGMLLTLKMLQWSLADEIPAYLERIRSWGFASVRAKQLQTNRSEVCVAAERAG